MKSKAELKDLITFLRSEGVLLYEQDGIRLTLAPERPEPVEAPVRHRIPPAVVDKQYGLTEEQQIDLFNAVVNPVNTAGK